MRKMKQYLPGDDQVNELLHDIKEAWILGEGSDEIVPEDHEMKGIEFEELTESPHTREAFRLLAEAATDALEEKSFLHQIAKTLAEEQESQDSSVSAPVASKEKKWASWKTRSGLPFKIRHAVAGTVLLFLIGYAAYLYHPAEDSPNRYFLPATGDRGKPSFIIITDSQEKTISAESVSVENGVIIERGPQKTIKQEESQSYFSLNSEDEYILIKIKK